ncbi:MULTISPECIES: hypothetical protein [Kribbella]|uniref:hypothetical protein n=1 Tax=Kribbella TaxID=182639 RepID=UPI00104BDA10|nr:MULTISPECIES: hypothetical protein [Kribbella]
MSSKQHHLGGTSAGAASQARVHRTVTAVGLVGSAALVAVGGVLAPPNSGEPDELYRIATEASGRLMAEAIVMVVSSILLVFGVIGAARLVQGRGRYLARAAALLGVMGALGHMAYSTFALLPTRSARSKPSTPAPAARSCCRSSRPTPSLWCCFPSRCTADG